MSCLEKVCFVCVFSFVGLFVAQQLWLTLQDVWLVGVLF